MKKLLFLILLSGNFLKLSSQTVKPLPIQRFGVKAGGNYCMMNFNKGQPPPSSEVKNTWKAGFDVGFLLQFPLNRYLTLQPEYTYMQKHGEDDRIKALYTMNYLSFPLLLKISLAKRFAIIAGPQFDLLIHSVEKKNGNTDITRGTEERNISAVIGLEAEITRSFFVYGRYMHGLNHVSLRQPPAEKEFKWAGVAIGMGMRL